MKANMLVFAPLCLLFCWMLPVDTKKISGNFTLRNDKLHIRMNMAEDSVDDMYSSCGERMEKIVLQKYFEHEKNTSVFGVAWTKAKTCANKPKEKEDSALTKYHMQAICVYTSGYKQFYELFNKAVRTNRSVYGTGFQYHSLHFWLTQAVQILQKGCHTTYRRSKAQFTGAVNEIVRFGYFTSTSKLPTLTQFGDETCFKIKTCFGAYLKKYPHLKDREQEVLIPPYEMFSITQKNAPVRELSGCKTVYVLKSAGIKSNLDCHLANVINT